MHEIDKLQELLSRLPGIGPRQARRFAFFLMQSSSIYIDELISTVTKLRQEKHHCAHCNSVFFTTPSHAHTQMCSVCNNDERDSTKLLIVAKQADFENINSSNSWDGYYFILNKTLRLSDKNPENSLPLGLLAQRIDDFNLQEIVIALPLNPEGEYTTQVLEDALIPLVSKQNISISHPARGLSSGSELEYSDHRTLQSALENRR